MEKQTGKLTMGQLKCEKQALREVLRGESWTMADADRYKEVLNKLRYVESIVLWCCVLVIMFMAGCTASIGGGASASAFYPKKWESPESRKQHTQPTMGMARNNLPMVGGD